MREHGADANALVTTLPRGGCLAPRGIDRRAQHAWRTVGLIVARSTLGALWD